MYGRYGLVATLPPPPPPPIVCAHFLTERFINTDRLPLLAPPAERQRSFSNTDLSAVRPSVCLSVRLSVKIEGGGVYLRNASVTFPLFWHEASFG